MRIFFVVFSVVFLSGCFIFPRNGMLPVSRRVQVHPEADVYQPVKSGEYTPLQKIKTYWYHPRREGVTRAQVQRERNRGYTASARCQRHHSHSINMALTQEASIVRGGNDVIDVRYGGYYRGGYRRRQLVCWAEGTVVQRGSNPPPQPSGFIRVRQCNRGRCGQWTRW